MTVSQPGASVPIEDVTGAEQLGIGQPSNERARVMGYPNGANEPVTCDNWTRAFSAQFTALRHFALDGTDHASHQEQAKMIRRYIIWRNNHAYDERLRRVVDRQTWPDTRSPRAGSPQRRHEGLTLHGPPAAAAAIEPLHAAHLMPHLDEIRISFFDAAAHELAAAGDRAGQDLHELLAPGGAQAV
ncbi:MAG TPA: hypothetical protein VE733_04350 [Streptosporangiaceae bacterium]|nr:hypothetical protein [Streptosporangiaceae bacterium]